MMMFTRGLKSSTLRCVLVLVILCSLASASGGRLRNLRDVNLNDHYNSPANAEHHELLRGVRRRLPGVSSFFKGLGKSSFFKGLGKSSFFGRRKKNPTKPPTERSQRGEQSRKRAVTRVVRRTPGKGTMLAGKDARPLDQFTGATNEKQRYRMFFEGLLSKIAKVEADKVEKLQCEKVFMMNVKNLIEKAKSTARGTESTFLGNQIIQQLCLCFSSLVNREITPGEIRGWIMDPASNGTNGKDNYHIIDFMYNDCINALRQNPVYSTGKYEIDVPKVTKILASEKKVKYIQKLYDWLREKLLEDDKSHEAFAYRLDDLDLIPEKYSNTCLRA